MKKYIILFALVLFPCMNCKGQSNNIVVSTFGPQNEVYPLNAKINAIVIYEQYTELEIRFTNKQSSNFLRISSKSYIVDNNNNNDIYPILAYKGNALDQPYNMGKQGEMNYISLIFERIPPGMQKINVILNPEDNSPWIWKGVTIKNPDEHPKTSWSEQSLKSDWGNNGAAPIEGIYEATSITNSANKYKIGVKKIGNQYQLIYLSGAVIGLWKTGQVKAFLTETATPMLFKAKWFMGNKVPNENCYLTFEPGLMKVVFTGPSTVEDIYLKMYPTNSTDFSSRDRKATGTGFALTSDGIIVTNNHVIEGASTISIKGINGNFDKGYKGKVVITDKNNDLAIIKIDDNSFTALGKVPYTIRSSSASTGESVYVLGYPLISTMGNEIKLTNGIISSKSGFQGDITSYQISVPVQPGNSGGPLLDNQGNLIGIINAKHVGAENVSYAIKVNYLNNLIDLIDGMPALQTVSSLNGKTLPQQVEILRKYVYIIEVN